MAIISEEDKRRRLEVENARVLALHKKKELAAQKKLLGKKIITEKYNEVKDEFINPKLLDFEDLDDCFKAIERKPALDEQFGDITEKERLILFAQMQDDLKFYALGDTEKFASEDEVVESSKKLVKILDDRNAVVKNHFHTHVPIYTEYVCSCCGTPKRITEFYRSWSFVDSARVDDKNMFRKPICKNCCKRIFEYFYLEVYEKDAVKAMERYCAETNTYWDYDLYLIAVKQQKAHNFERHIVGEYAICLGIRNIYATYWDSPNVQNRTVTATVSKSVDAVDGKDPTLGLGVGTKDGWSAVDKKNKNKILKLFGYDPFAHIEEEEELKKVYRDFLNLLDEDMENDLVKLQAAAQIVASYSRIRGIDKEYESKIKLQVGTKALKDISDLKAKELKAISDFAKDNGFAARFASAKAKGENTFTGILSRMNNAKFEKAAVNGYDILTSQSIQEVADASFKAIFSQLNLGEADVWKQCQMQLEELVKLRDENAALREKTRLAEYRAAEAQLSLRAYREHGDDDGS